MMEELTATLLTENQTLLNLGLALLLGAVIGLQRGWQARDREAGSRIAGIRTHSLTGLLGGLSAVLSKEVSVWALPVLFSGLAALSLAGYILRAQEARDYSITGLIGLWLTFTFGAGVMVIEPAIPAAAAVITAMILDNKQPIHDWLTRLAERELDAALRLLLITVVVLPMLPNRGLGPGGVLNPYEIWWLVVLIASVSFVGYFAMKLGGTSRGILFTSLFAGLSSSTALTLHFARLSQRSPDLSRKLASGVLIACGTMFPRILLYCLLISPALLPQLLAPVLVMTIILFGSAFVVWHTGRLPEDTHHPELSQNPLDLKSALFFGVLLTVIMLLGYWLKEWLGDSGIYLLAATSGVTDVDAITLSLTRMSQTSLSPEVAALGIVIAASVNNLVKAGMAGFIATPMLALRVGVPMVLSLLVGLGSAIF